MDDSGRQAHLLYIDDDDALRQLVRRRMERRGYRVSLANGGAEGVELAAREDIDVIAVDHYMPGQDGLATLAQLLGAGPAPPVVYVTGSDEISIAVAALKAGAVDYVVKSGGEDFTELLDSAVRQALEQVDLRRDKERAEQALRNANARLEDIVNRQAVLLREVNHRVANSLQLVSSLVQMQANLVADAGAKGALEDTQHRIAAIMQIHRRLYTSDDVEQVEMRDYLVGLIGELQHSVAASEANRPIRLDVEPIRLKTDQAVSLGVVVTELVTNACKYAYAPGEAGEVRVRLCALGAAGHRLVVEDDGRGIDEAAPSQGTGLGRRVVAAMARSLGSRLVFDPTHAGARAVLDFGP
jgi:two-component sensor histidine kinase